MQALILLLVVSGGGGAHADIFADRENLADSDTKSVLNNLRESKQKNAWTFDVGYTAALDVPLDRLTGLRPPQDFLEQAAQKNARQKQAPRDDRAGIEGADPSAPVLDLRRLSKVTAVRNQLACGSCWAFTTLGAYESSYAVRNNQFVNASEQSLLNCSGAGTCAGGWWAFDHLIDRGVAKESKYPYTAVEQPCKTAIPTPYRAVTWNYVSAASAIPSVDQIKEQLCRHGALAVAVNATGAFQAYTGGVFNENATGQVNHGVTLIGWDDGKQAWLIKNSWGANWGSTCGYGAERGYMWIRYGSNSIGYASAWVDATGAAAKPTQLAGSECDTCGPDGESIGLNLLCQVKVTNYVQGAVVQQIVSQFFFDGGGQYYCDKDVSIGHGESRYCDSNTNSRCTKRVSTVIRGKHNGQTFALTHETEVAPSGECWIMVPLELTPARMVSAAIAKTEEEQASARIVLQPAPR